MMNKKLQIIIGITVFIGLGIILIAEYFIIRQFGCPDTDNVISQEEVNAKPKAMMLLIEFKNTDGLVNMVNDMDKRNIKGVLLVNADFVEKNQEAIRKILTTGNIEIAASYDPKPYWEMSYDEQYATITDMITRIDKALNIKVRIISSRYMASDENTVKIADKLGIEYITARGTTGLATTVYKPQEYNVKIISVSNIEIPEFEYGSFCDYSFYERSGSPEDMTKEFEKAIKEEKFIGTSHTYIGGYKSRWNNMWHKFWDNYAIDWVDLDTLGTIDKVMPMWQIPVNKNAPYTPEKIRPAIPYDEEENVINPCKVDDINNTNTAKSNDDKITYNRVIIFHNNTGPMCLEALEFLNVNNIVYEEHLTTDVDFYEKLNAMKINNVNSEGVSTDYEYYPYIFIDGKAFSGFNDEVKSKITNIINHQ